MSRATRYDVRDDLIAESNDLNGDIDMTLTKFQFASKGLPRPPIADEAVQMIDLDIAIVPGDSHSIYSHSCNSNVDSVYIDLVKEAELTRAIPFTSVFFEVQSSVDTQSGHLSSQNLGLRWQGQKKASQRPRVEGKSFACPFHKFDQSQYSACQTWSCQTIESVKRHVLGPKHRSPAEVNDNKFQQSSWLGVYTKAEDRWLAMYSKLFNIPQDCFDSIPSPYYETLREVVDIDQAHPLKNPYEQQCQDLETLKALRRQDLRSTADRLGLHLQDINQNKQSLLVDWLDSISFLSNGHTRGTNPEQVLQGYPSLATEDEALNFEDLLPNRPLIPYQEPLIQESLHHRENLLVQEFYKTLPKAQALEANGQGIATVPEEPCTCSTTGNFWCLRCDEPDVAVIEVT